jgi:GTP-sensing pleiotropic transcriptional regulator CodY
LRKTLDEVDVGQKKRVQGTGTCKMVKKKRGNCTGQCIMEVTKKKKKKLKNLSYLAFLEKLFKKLTGFMETESSLPCSQNLILGPYWMFANLILLD